MSVQQAEWPAKDGFEVRLDSNIANSPIGLPGRPSLTLSSLAELNEQADTLYVLLRPNSNHSITLPTPAEAALRLRTAQSRFDSEKEQIQLNQIRIQRMTEGLQHSINKPQLYEVGKQQIADLEAERNQHRKLAEEAESEWTNYQSYLKLLKLDIDDVHITSNQPNNI